MTLLPYMGPVFQSQDSEEAKVILVHSGNSPTYNFAKQSKPNQCEPVGDGERLLLQPLGSSIVGVEG